MSSVQFAEQAICAPLVRFFAGRSESFIQLGSEWRRAMPEEEARMHTGYDRETHEPHIGVYVTKRPNGMIRIGFDLWKLNFNLRPAAIERIEARWRQEAASLPKQMLRNVARRAHFSKSFGRFEISPEHLEGWRAELEYVLSNQASFERLERAPSTANRTNPKSPQT